MELIRPLTTTAVRLVATKTNTPLFIPDFIKAIQNRYRFWQVPQSIDEYLRQEGAEFRTGLHDRTPINVMRIFSEGVLAESNVHSDHLDAFLDDLLAWVGSEFDVDYELKKPFSRGYTSTVEVSSRGAVSQYLGKLNDITKLLTTMVNRSGYETAQYEFAALIAVVDPSEAKAVQPGRFVFDRRADQPFASNIFFSEAPLSTTDHLALLDELEAILTSA